MKKIFTLLVKKFAAIYPTAVAEKVTAFCYTTVTTDIIHHNYINDPARAGSFFFSKNDQQLKAINQEPEISNQQPGVTEDPETSANDDSDNYRDTADNNDKWADSKKHLRVNDDMALCNTTSECKTKAHSNDAIRPFASFSFSPLTVAFSNAASAKKESYPIQLAKRFLFSNKAYNLRNEKLNKVEHSDHLIAGPDRRFFLKTFLNKSGLFVIVLLISNLFFINKSFGQGPGAAWTFYRPVTLSPATPSANFQVKVTLIAGQYTNMKADGSDLRFYDNTNTNCEYWLETWNTSGTSTIWVKVPTSGATALLMYYGNAAATAVSNGANVFDFFDDCTSLANWSTVTTGGSVTQSGTNITLSNTNGGTVSLSNTSAFVPVSTSCFFLKQNIGK